MDDILTSLSNGYQRGECLDMATHKLAQETCGPIKSLAPQQYSR